MRFTVLMLLIVTSSTIAFADDFIPRRQDKPPGPPLSPQEAIAKMTVPEGFAVELVASEPQVINPVGMAIDERGRFWVTESFEYPRREPGPGRDKVKVLEDTTGDGKVDKVTVFAEGLNIPSGIAVGYGGVWVANAPDILFMRDTTGDGKADTIETVVTGFGRTDTHELPNSLTWGPDGWLYGLNGVFNYCDVKYARENPNYDANHPGWKFTCALFRIHPRTREFQLFAEGTSNPWGIAFNDNGEAFLSACVIDHLWHLTETGYYHRQGGPYPPHTWKLESIVNHKHQLAAYCGIHYYDADAYPEEYRGKLYMGNIHGNCINADALRRDGSTYFGTIRPDLLSANDVWFMPVVQKTGPDGCLYILDWYDRYHCYQDANRDPEGIDRGHGRLYRLRYKETPHTPADFDMGAETDEQLLGRLGQHNDFIRWTAHRLLAERSNSETRRRLERMVFDGAHDRQTRLFAAWTAFSMSPDPDNPLIESEFIGKLKAHPDATLRAWAVRAAGDQAVSSWPADRGTPEQVAELVEWAAGDQSADVRLQGVILAGRHSRKSSPPPEYAQQFGHALINSPDDKLLPKIVWQNLMDFLRRHPEQGAAFATLPRIAERPEGREIVSRLVAWLLDRPRLETEAIATIITHHAADKGGNPATADDCLAMITREVQNRTLAGDKLNSLRSELSPLMQRILARDSQAPPFYWSAMLAASWNDAAAVKTVGAILTDSAAAEHDRLNALSALISAGDEEMIVATLDDVLADRDGNSSPFRGRMISTLGQLRTERVAGVLLKHYDQLEPELKPRALDLLTQRAAWSKQLLAAIGNQSIPTTALNLNQVRRLIDSGDEELAALVGKHWGQVRNDRSPERDKIIGEMKQLIRGSSGDPFQGELVFNKVCALCHKMHGKGQEVGPDITLNGRNSFEQLLSNVFDPSLVIGASYQSYTVVTDEGRVLNGLLVEDTDEKITLKVQGGKLETIPRAAIEIAKKSSISLMPEDLEKQLKPEELVDLFAYLTLDKHPSDPTARQLPGVKEVVPRVATNPQQFKEVIGEIAPGFTTSKAGEGDVALLREHMNRATVVRTHPISRTEPCVLHGTFDIPSGRKTWLLVEAAHHPDGDWKLIAKANGTTLLSDDIGTPATQGWQSYQMDLSQYAGQTIKLELENRATGWSNEYGYWGRIAVASE